MRLHFFQKQSFTQAIMHIMMNTHPRASPHQGFRPPTRAARHAWSPCRPLLSFRRSTSPTSLAFQHTPTRDAFAGARAGGWLNPQHATSVAPPSLPGFANPTATKVSPPLFVVDCSIAPRRARAARSSIALSRRK